MGIEHRAGGVKAPENIRLTNFSPALALKFAQGSISLEKPEPQKPGETVSYEVSGSVLTSFAQKQEAERKSYWQEKGMTLYAQQMEQWLHGDSNSGGVVEWLEEAMKDPDIQPFFKNKNSEKQTSGLDIYSTIEGDLTQHKQRIQPVIDAMNQSSGGSMTFEALANDPSRHIDISALQLYATYLTRGEEGIRSLIDEFVNVAKEGSTYEEARAKLQKMVPLMNMFGDNAQQTFAAITDAQLRLDYPDEREALEGMPKDKLALTTSDIQVLTYLQDDNAVTDVPQRRPKHRVPPPPVVPDIKDDGERNERDHQPEPLVPPLTEESTEE